MSKRRYPGHKGKLVPINTLGDLTHALNQIIPAFNERMNKLCRRNRGLTVLAMVAIGCTIFSEAERKKQEEKVYQLSVRVKRLEHGEGE